jgi:hypothetical protein
MALSMEFVRMSAHWQVAPFCGFLADLPCGALTKTGSDPNDGSRPRDMRRVLTCSGRRAALNYC